MSEISCSCAFLGMTTKANTLVWNRFWNLMLVVQYFWLILKSFKPLVFHHSRSVQFQPHRNLFLLLMTVPKPLVQEKFFLPRKGKVLRLLPPFNLLWKCPGSVIESVWLWASWWHDIRRRWQVDKFLQSAARSKPPSLEVKRLRRHFGRSKWLEAWKKVA